MKRLSSLPNIIILILMIAGTGRAAAQVGETRVVATVNDSVITEQDILKAAQPRFNQLNPALSDAEHAEAVAAIMRETLRVLIDARLFKAKASGLVKDHPTLKDQLKELIAQRLERERREAGSETAFRERLRKQDISLADYVKDLEQTMLQDLLIRQFVYSGVSVSRDEILDYYETRGDSLSDPPRVKFRRLFLKGPAYGGSLETRERAGEIEAKLREGADFAALAREYSDGPHAAEGGLWDFESRGSGRPALIEELLFTTPVGEVGGPVETDGDVTFVRILERESAEAPSFEEAEPEIRERLEREKRTARYLDFVARLEAESFVEIRGLK